MNLRLTKLDEFQFLTCFKHGVWGSNRPRFGKWKQGDHLGFIVNGHLAGLAQVNGEPYMDDEPIWDKDLFPYRIPVEFVHVSKPQRRSPIQGKIRDALLSSTRSHSYGVYLLNQSILPEKTAKMIVESIAELPNDLGDVRAKIEKYLKNATS